MSGESCNLVTRVVKRRKKVFKRRRSNENSSPTDQTTKSNSQSENEHSPTLKTRKPVVRKRKRYNSSPPRVAKRKKSEKMTVFKPRVKRSSPKEKSSPLKIISPNYESREDKKSKPKTLKIRKPVRRVSSSSMDSEGSDKENRPKNYNSYKTDESKQSKKDKQFSRVCASVQHEDKPIISPGITKQQLLKYYSLPHLKQYCKDNNIKRTGTKEDLAQAILDFFVCPVTKNSEDQSNDFKLIQTPRLSKLRTFSSPQTTPVTANRCIKGGQLMFFRDFTPSDAGYAVEQEEESDLVLKQWKELNLDCLENMKNYCERNQICYRGCSRSVLRIRILNHLRDKLYNYIH